MAAQRKVKKTPSGTVKTSTKTKPKRGSKTRPITPMEPDCLTLSPVVVFSDQVDPEDLAEDYVPGNPSPDTPLVPLEGEESPSTITSVNASPHISPIGSPVRPSSRGFGGAITGSVKWLLGGWWGEAKQEQPAPPLVGIPQRNGDDGTAYEVVHVFARPGDAIGHENLMRRARSRLSRASIEGNIGPVAWEGLPNVPVEQFPGDERVILVRRVLSPRDDRPLPRSEVIAKAAGNPALWFFLPESEATSRHSVPLCEYLMARSQYPVSSDEEEVERQSTPAPTSLLPVFTPTFNVVNNLPPNSIEAPLRDHRDQGRDLRTPAELETPNPTFDKSQDRGGRVMGGSDAENASPLV